MPLDQKQTKAPIKQKLHTKKARRLIPIQDICRVIMAAPMPEKALLAAYGHTAGRRGEVLRWTWAEDVNLTERWVRLHSLLAEVWQKHRDKNSPYVFPRYYQPDDRGNNPTGERRAHRLLLGYTKNGKPRKASAGKRQRPVFVKRPAFSPSASTTSGTPRPSTLTTSRRWA